MAHTYNSQLDAYALYHKQKENETLSNLGGPALPALGHAIAGSTGTAISNLALYPLDLIITRLQVQRQFRKTADAADEGEYSGVLDAAAKIYHLEGGISAFYTGILQDTGKSIADSFFFFLFYNYLRQNRLQKYSAKTTTLPALDELGVGVLAGACSKFLTAPLSNIVTRKQTSRMLSSRSSSSSHHEPTVSEIASQIRNEKGLLGFWSGYSASLVLTLNPSLTFFLYETFKQTLLPRSKRENPGARITFLMAAFSKAIASTITYPFSLAKARTQASSKAPMNPDDAEILKDDVSELKNENISNKDEKSKARRGVGKDFKATTKRSTVFSTILEIYRTEGPAALYEGISGEICKGFFSHGMTMLVKEAVHKFIIQLYFFILRTLNRFSDQVPEVTEESKERAGDIYEDAKEQAGNFMKRSQVMGNIAIDAAGSIYAEAKGQAQNLVNEVQVLGNNATGVAKTRVGYPKSEAETVLDSARGVVGKSMEQAGKNIRTWISEGDDE